MTETTETVQYQLDSSSSSKLTDWPAEPSLLTLKNDFEMAKPSHDSLVTKVRKWNNLLEVEGDAKPPKIKGRSSVQPKLVKRQAEWRYPALSEPFLSSDNLFKVDPVTFEDGQAARQNGLLLNYQFRSKLDRVKLVDDTVRATVDDGSCVLRTGWKRSTVMVKKQVPVFSYYPINNQQSLDLLQQALNLRASDPRTYNEKASPELKASVDYYDETQQTTFAKQTGTTEVEEEKILENRPTVEVLNLENVYFDPSCNGDIDKALFAVVSFETNKAELQKEGRYKNLDQVLWESNAPLNDPDHATSTPDSFSFKDESREKVVAYEYWGFYDVLGDGTLVGFVATWIGSVLIRMELNPFPDGKLPFVVIPYSPIKRQLFGVPDAEVLEDNQKILGAVTRGMIDLLGNSANGQKGFAKRLAVETGGSSQC